RGQREVGHERPETHAHEQHQEAGEDGRDDAGRSHDRSHLQADAGTVRCGWDTSGGAGAPGPRYRPIRDMSWEDARDVRREWSRERAQHTLHQSQDSQTVLAGITLRWYGGRSGFMFGRWSGAVAVAQASATAPPLLEPPNEGATPCDSRRPRPL